MMGSTEPRSRPLRPCSWPRARRNGARLPNRFDDADLQRIRDATDLVALFGERTQMRQKGQDWWCCCPFHEEKTPSCKVDGARGLWHCFGCGEGGDLFKYIMKVEDLSFPEAVRYLAARANIDLPEPSGGPAVPQSRKQRLREVCAEAARFYHTLLMRGKGEGPEAARSYLGGRGLGGDVPAEWDLGFAPGHTSLVNHLRGLGFTLEEMIDANVASANRSGQARDRFFNRVMFPICDVKGECIAFGGRVMGTGEPKYLNSQETPIFHKSETLYGLHKAKAAMASTGTAIVVEGYTDVIALHRAGLANTVATLGTALTQRHIRLLGRHARHRIVYLFDGDEAGQRAAERALGFIDSTMTPEAGPSRIDLCAVTLPDDLDPADFVEQRGGEALRTLVDEARPLLSYGIDRRIAQHDLGSIEGRTRALADALSLLAPIKDSVLAKQYAVEIAGRVRAREEDALAQLAALKAPKRYVGHEEAAPVPMGPGAVPEAAVEGYQPTLAPPERNRLRFERELLALLAQNPALALAHAELLAQTQWRSEAHGLIAQSLLATLEADPSAAPAAIIAEAAVVAPDAPSILTAASTRPGVPAERVASYLGEELAIGDMEDAAGALKAQLAAGQALAPDESEALFASLVALQKDLSAKRLAHKPLV